MCVLIKRLQYKYTREKTRSIVFPRSNPRGETASYTIFPRLFRRFAPYDTIPQHKENAWNCWLFQHFQAFSNNGEGGIRTRIDSYCRKVNGDLYILNTMLKRSDEPPGRCIFYVVMSKSVTFVFTRFAWSARMWVYMSMVVES